MIWSGESLSITLFIEDHGEPFWIFDELSHDGAAKQSLEISRAPLASRRRHFANLAAFENSELIATGHQMIQRSKAFACFLGPKVEKNISEIATVLEIDGQVNEVQVEFETVFVELLHKHVTRILVGDVPQHDGRALCR